MLMKKFGICALLSAAICKYGGGGHAVVGAVSLRPEDVELGRQYMAEIIETLQFPD